MAKRAPIRIGIVGTGGMAKAHAMAYRGIPGVELAACLDSVPGKAEAFAAAEGAGAACSSFDDLLGRVDAVSIVTPDRFHAEGALRVLAARKHLLCEKPLTVTLAEARRVAKAATAAGEHGVVHMTNFSYRRAAAFQEAIRLVAAGKLGEVRHIHAHYLQGWLTHNPWGDLWGPGFLWRLRTADGSGGVLGDIGCHLLDLATAVAGPVARVRCDLRTFPKIKDGRAITAFGGKDLDANDTAAMSLEFAGGAFGVVHTTRWATGRANQIRCEVHGTAGALAFDLDAGYEVIDLCLGRDVATGTWKRKTLKPAPSVWDRFIAAIRTGRADQPDVLRGAEIQAQLDACFRSGRSGRWERVPTLTA